MRRRRSRSLGNLNSLLVTLTNAVGILVILLTATQIGVGDAVKRIHGALIEAPADDLEQLQERAAELERQIAERGPQSADADKQHQADGATLVTVELLMREVLAALARLPQHKTKVNELRQLVSHREQQVTELEQQLAQNEQELEQIGKELEAVPEPAAEDTKTVGRLPNPREVPEDWTENIFVCRNGQIMRLDDPTLLKRAQDTIARSPVGRSAPRLVLGRREAQGIDCEGLIELFADKDVGNGYFRIQAGVREEVPYLVYAARQRGGESLEKIADSQSAFRQVIRRVRRRGEFIKFLVWPDSFDVYLAARAQTEELALSAGWELRQDGTEYQRALVDTRGQQVYCEDYKPPRDTPKLKTPVDSAQDAAVAGRKVPPRDMID